MMLITDRAKNGALADIAVRKIEAALETTRGAANRHGRYQAQLPKRRRSATGSGASEAGASRTPTALGSLRGRGGFD
jgi:hypothetical protein